MPEVEFHAGEQIFAQGDPSDQCYKIVSGRVEILLDVQGTKATAERSKIAVCVAGELFGEMGVIDGAPRSASAVAVEPTICTAYRSDEFLKLLQQTPGELLAYLTLLNRRVRNTNDLVSRPTSRFG